MQGLMDLMKEKEWASRVHTDSEGKLLNLFFASPDGIQLGRQFPTVLGLDSTYKTNRFQFPMLHIVGTTNTHRSFTLAVVFMSNESETSYEWALTQLRAVVFDTETCI